MADPARISAIGDAHPDRRCPDCGKPLTLVNARCPRPGTGCGVVHAEWACQRCRHRQWDEHDRPASIGEVKALAQKVDRLIKAMGLKYIGDDDG